MDSTDASIASMLAFTEHNFGLSPLNENDANAYDYANSFDYSQAPLAMKSAITTLPEPKSM